VCCVEWSGGKNDGEKVEWEDIFEWVLKWGWHDGSLT
jgi:hypothetical protein